MESSLEAVNQMIAKQCKRVGRKAQDVRLVAVSKTFNGDQIRPLLESGQRIFGENRVQEAAAKWEALRKDFEGICLHLIGPLQSNKVREAVELFDVIESVDRPKIARCLAEEMRRQGRRLPVFLQVNTGEEAQKAGVDPQSFSSFVALCRDELGLDVQGVMCVPPLDQPPAPHFALLAKLAKEHSLKELSMGMSADFEAAISQGATFVRIGSLLFGKREALLPS